MRSILPLVKNKTMKFAGVCSQNKKTVVVFFLNAPACATLARNAVVNTKKRT